MRCNHLHELLPGYLDGSLSGRQDRLVSDHLDACERCRAELSSQQRALSALDAGRHAVTIDLWADFSRRLQEQSRPPVSARRRPWQPGWAFAAAAVTVALIARLASGTGPASTSHFPAIAPVRIARSVGTDTTVGSPLGGPVTRLRDDQMDRTVGRSAHSTPTSVAAARRVASRNSNSSHRRLARGRHSWRSPVPSSSVQPRGAEPRAYQVAQLPVSSVFAEKQETSPRNALGVQSLDSGASLDAAADLGSHVEPAIRPEVAGARSGDPLRVALALAAVEKDTASSQMGGELLRMAREVARVSGETGGADFDRATPGAESTTGGSHADRSNPTGT